MGDAGVITAVVSLASPWWLDSAGHGWCWRLCCCTWEALSPGPSSRQRMRLTVQVRDAAGKDDEGATTQLIAMLRELGGDPRRGSKYPAAPMWRSERQGHHGRQGRMARRRAHGHAGLLGVTPWRVAVDLRDSGEAHAVMTATAGTLDPQSRGEPLRHRRTEGRSGGHGRGVRAAHTEPRLGSGFDGLAGARTGAVLGGSLGRPTMTSRRITRSRSSPTPSTSTRQNLAAQIALRHLLYRQSTDDAVWSGTEVARRSALSTRQIAGAGSRAVRVRLLHTATAVALNRWHELAGERKTESSSVPRSWPTGCASKMSCLGDGRIRSGARCAPSPTSCMPCLRARPEPCCPSGAWLDDLGLRPRVSPRTENDTEEAIESARVGDGERGRSGRSGKRSFLATSQRPDEFLSRYPGTPRTDMLDVDPFKTHADTSTRGEPHDP